MSIRFNPDLYANIVAGLNNNNVQQSNALLEISTGRRVQAPSDDPSATAAVINIHSQSAQMDQYAQNVNNLQGLLQTADSTMSSVITSLNQAISLGVQSGDSTLSPTNRATLSTQLQNVSKQILTLANTSYQGTYIFSGTNSNQPAYVTDPNPLSANGVTYQGNANANSVEVAPGQNINMNVPGSQLFTNAAGDVFAALKNMAQAAATGNGIPAAVDQLKTAFDTVNAQRTQYGTSLSQLQTASTFLATSKLQLSTQENNAVGIDLAQAASDVQKALTQRSAILAVGGKIQNTSLLDYLQ
jgi:flagellar hook-associated protein 3 FlgL